MKGRSLVATVAITTATLGVTAGIAYAALPSTSTGIVRSAAPAYNLVLGPQVGGTSHRHVAQAKCGGAPVVSGGYDMQGALGPGGYGFNTDGAPAPRAVPVVIASVPSRTGLGGGTYDAWTVIAIAPKNFSSKWFLRTYAICG